MRTGQREGWPAQVVRPGIPLRPSLQPTTSREGSQCRCFLRASGALVFQERHYCDFVASTEQ